MKLPRCIFCTVVCALLPMSCSTRQPPASGPSYQITQQKQPDDELDYSPISPRYASESIRSLLAAHAKPRTSGELNSAFALTWFLDDGQMAERYLVNTDGSELAFRDVYDWAIQNSGQHDLGPEKLRRLRVLLHALPPSGSKIPVENLVVVSGYDQGRWMIRWYNTKTLPDPVHQMLTVLGERSDITAFRSWR